MGPSRQHSSFGFHKMREFYCLANWVDCSLLHEDYYVIFTFLFVTNQSHERHVQVTESEIALQNTVDIFLSTYQFILLAHRYTEM